MAHSARRVLCTPVFKSLRSRSWLNAQISDVRSVTSCSSISLTWTPGEHHGLETLAIALEGSADASGGSCGGMETPLVRLSVTVADLHLPSIASLLPFTSRSASGKRAINVQPAVAHVEPDELFVGKSRFGQRLVCAR